MNPIKPDTIVIVGAGGGASYLLPPLARTLLAMPRRPDVYIIDADILEARNLDRQLFLPADVGRPKAEAMTAMYADLHATPVVDWFTVSCCLADQMRRRRVLWFGCADNHVARRDILAVVDRHPQQASVAIIGGNETYDADAYFYHPSWRNHPVYDPRQRFPEILTDDSGAPAGTAGCTGPTAVRDNPQLPTANLMSAAGMLWLYQFWTNPVVRQLDSSLLPFQFTSTLTNVQHYAHSGT